MEKAKLHRDKEWLRKKYHEEKLSSRDMAKLAGVGKDAILKNMKRLGIPRRERIRSVQLAYKQGKFTGGREGGFVGKPITPVHREALNKGIRKKWKGHRTEHNLGYYLVRDEENNQVLEHRLVMERHLGRPIKPTEDVHHINGDRKDNRIENLHLFKNRSNHSYYHKMKELGRDVELKYEYRKGDK